jgi:hypothetical protein
MLRSLSRVSFRYDGTQFTCFISTKVQIMTQTTSTKVQILTQTATRSADTSAPPRRPDSTLIPLSPVVKLVLKLVVWRKRARLQRRLRRKGQESTKLVLRICTSQSFTPDVRSAQIRTSASRLLGRATKRTGLPR